MEISGDDGFQILVLVRDMQDRHLRDRAMTISASLIVHIDSDTPGGTPLAIR
jgi:hypothetical protein